MLAPKPHQQLQLSYLSPSVTMMPAEEVLFLLIACALLSCHALTLRPFCIVYRVQKHISHLSLFCYAFYRDNRTYPCPLLRPTTIHHF